MLRNVARACATVCTPDKEIQSVGGGAVVATSAGMLSIILSYAIVMAGPDRALMTYDDGYAIVISAAGGKLTATWTTISQFDPNDRPADT